MVLLIMPVNPIIFKVTDVGRDAAAYAFNNLPGGKLSLSTIKVGLAKYSTVGNETALQNPLPNTFSIGGGGVQAGSGQIRFTPILASTTRIEAFEIGLFTDTGILFAIAATPSNNPLLVIEPDIEAIFSMNVALANVDPNSIQIVVDVNAPLAVVMMGQHLSAAHPHSQYKRTLDNTERLKAADAQDVDDVVTKAQLEAEETARGNADLALSIALAAEITNRENADNALLNGISQYSGLGQLTLLSSGNHSVPVKAGETVRVILIAGGGGGGGYDSQDGFNGTQSNVSAPEGWLATANGGVGGLKGYGAESGSYVNDTPARAGTSFNRNRLDVMRVLYRNDDVYLPTLCDGYGSGGLANPTFPSNWRRASDGGRGGHIEILYRNDSPSQINLTINVGSGGLAGDAGATNGADGLAAINSILV